MKNIESFLDRTGIVLKLKEPFLEPFEVKGFGTWGVQKFLGDTIVVTTLRMYGKGLNYLTYYYEGKIHSLYIPDGFKVKELVDEEGIKVKENYQEWLIKNLETNLQHAFNIGSDPEVFIEDDKGEIIPAFDFLNAKGKDAHKTEQQKMPMYWDGFQAEFETIVGTCLQGQVGSVRWGLDGILKLAQKHNKKAQLSSKTVMEISPELLAKSKDEHVNFGCMPSLNIYGMKGKDIPAREIPFRPAGGHIHFGIGPKTKEEVERIVKALDAIIGVACVSLFASFDNPQRRMLYGLAGEYRLPKHGIEYRTLSNAWLIHPLIMNLVFDLARKALVFGEKGLLKHWDATEEETINTINTCDVKQARKILKRNKKILLKMFKASYSNMDDSALAGVYDVFMHGLEYIVKDPNAIKENWNIGNTESNHVNYKEARNLAKDIASGKKVA